MNLRRSLAALLISAATLPLLAQNTPAPPAQNQPTQSTTAKSAPATRTAPKPQTEQAPGAGPDKVWVNNKSNVYHCPTDRYYGRTKDGKYMTEADAKKAGAHGVNNTTCFK